ncbi:uncharacterized protein LOC112637532 [Camponotus floridanus]|uniref:uncharacterized protein LOC112637532 n=1 Tax=Camponotus floridanus TaxID=104421 RepID=UPI000DC66B9E|nr:uncharacterized protein LOC112637532 [Camponotus floridanus]
MAAKNGITDRTPRTLGVRAPAVRFRRTIPPRGVKPGRRRIVASPGYLRRQTPGMLLPGLQGQPPGRAVETLHTQGGPEEDITAIPRRPHRRALGHRENHRPDCQEILLAGDVARDCRLRTSLPELPGPQGRSATTGRGTALYVRRPTLGTSDAGSRRSVATFAPRTYVAFRPPRPFTKWVELVPLRRATAAAVTKALTERILLRHGRPESGLLSDNGTQLRSIQLEERLRAWDIRHITVPAYSPHCNPVERTNRTVKTMITQYIDKDHRAWDEHIPALQFAYNTALHDATRYTPAFLNYGREMQAPEDTDPQTTVPDAPDVIRNKLTEAYEVMKLHLAQAFQRQKRHYDLRRRPWKPNVGEWM